MSADPRWEQFEELFERALGVPPAERAAWLVANCGENPELRAELESLLAGSADASAFLKQLGDQMVGPGVRGLVNDADSLRTIPDHSPDPLFVQELLKEKTEELKRLTAALAGRYAIEQLVGSGGMATVYLAEDLKHRRKVAIKVLRPELAAVLGTERFLQEIEVTAKLQHPNILPLFDSGTAESIPYYVMPFVDGESLAERLKRERQLPIEEAVSIAVAVCNALEYAHQRDVVHRDIKPANILLQSGQPIVADFGIALAVTAAGGQRLTQTGLSIGTPEYMSPEQGAGGVAVDGRTDQYAVACVLYEMLVGEPPHTGPSVQAIIAKVVTEPPRRIRAARETVPSYIERAVHRALAKLAADRYPTVARFADNLVNPSATNQWLGVVQLTGFSWRTWGYRAAIVLLATIAVLGWMRETAAGPGLPTKFDFPYPTGESFGAVRHALAISPDGSTIAYAGQGENTDQLYLRPLDQIESRALPGTDAALDPFFSPGGETVGFATVVGLMKLPVTGGAPIRVTEFPEPRGPSWGTDGIIRFGSTSGLWQVPDSGGTPRQITTLDSASGEVMHSRPQLLPGTDALLFNITVGGLDETQVAVLSMGSGKITRLFPGIAPRYSARTGHILYGRSDGMLMGVPFDTRRLEPTGPADTILSGITVKQTGSMDFDVSTNGSLIYLTGAAANGRLALVGRTGAQEFITAPEQFTAPSFSPDGQRIIVGRGPPPTRQIWIYEMADSSFAPVTFEGHNYYPVWSPDGSRFVFTTERASGAADLRWKASDGTGIAQMFLQADSAELLYPESWSPDGRYLVFRRQSQGGSSRDLWVMRTDGGEPPRPLFDLPSSLEDAARISPDGKRIAFASNLTGRYEIYISRFPDPGRRIQVSFGGGTEPAWSPDGREVFYWNGNDMMAASVTPGGLRVLDRQVLFTGRYARWVYHTNYDAHPDGQRFVMVANWGAGASQSVVVIVNWFEELRRLFRGGS